MNSYILLTVLALSSIGLVYSEIASKPCCFKWVRLNEKPLEYKGKDDQAAMFTIQHDYLVHKIKLIRRRGFHVCEGVDEDPTVPDNKGYFGCQSEPTKDALYPFITDNKDIPLFPALPYTPPMYMLSGYERPYWLPSIEIPVGRKFVGLSKEQELRLWNGEDWFNVERETERADSTVMVDVFAMISECGCE